MKKNNKIDEIIDEIIATYKMLGVDINSKDVNVTREDIYEMVLKSAGSSTLVLPVNTSDVDDFLLRVDTHMIKVMHDIRHCSECNMNDTICMIRQLKDRNVDITAEQYPALLKAFILDLRENTND